MLYGPDGDFAGTDDDVTLRLAGRSWDIDSDSDDFAISVT